MATDCFLIRWEGGWAYREDAFSVAFTGGIEALLGLGALTSLAEVYRVADGQLAEFARERVQTDILIAPDADAEWPYDPAGWVVGDDISVQGVTHRVLGIGVTEDNDTGRAIPVPTLNDDVILHPDERVFQAIRKMINGTFQGRSKVGQPVVPQYVPRNVIAGSGECACNEQTIVVPGPFVCPDSDFLIQTIGDLCTTDTRAALTVVACSGTQNNDVFVSVQFPDFDFGARVNAGGADASWRLLYGGGDIVAPFTDTLPAPGDILELTVTDNGPGLGVDLLAKRNGSTYFTTTYVPVVGGNGAGGLFLQCAPGGTVEVEDLTVETFCP